MRSEHGKDISCAEQITDGQPKELSGNQGIAEVRADKGQGGDEIRAFARADWSTLMSERGGESWESLPFSGLVMAEGNDD